MSAYKKADHRLVQPRPEHYRMRGSVKYLCGPYSLEQHDRYFEAMISLHMVRHPDSKQSDARRTVNAKWRNLIFATIGDEFIAANSRKAPNVVEIAIKGE